MKSFGLGDVVVRLIEAYLSGRVSRVHVGGEHSGAIPMHSGVPRGSMIGPLLFLLFVNDLPDVLETLTLLLGPSLMHLRGPSSIKHFHQSAEVYGGFSYPKDCKSISN